MDTLEARTRQSEERVGHTVIELMNKRIKLPRTSVFTTAQVGQGQWTKNQRIRETIEVYLSWCEEQDL